MSVIGGVLYDDPRGMRHYHYDYLIDYEDVLASGRDYASAHEGYFDEDGHLKIIDRAKDVGKLNDGALFAPKFLENKLKFYPYIKVAVAFGDGRDFAAAFLNIDMEAVGDWAERRHIPYASYQELAAKEEVYALLEKGVEQVIRDLATDPKLASSQIRRYLVLHKELDADDGELTRTRKVRRSLGAEKYLKLIDALYSDADHCEMEVEVTFEDGSKGSIKGDLKIQDLAPCQAVATAA